LKSTLGAYETGLLGTTTTRGGAAKMIGGGGGAGTPMFTPTFTCAASAEAAASPDTPSAIAVISALLFGMWPLL
jgi:hypothetical protein